MAIQTLALIPLPFPQPKTLTLIPTTSHISLGRSRRRSLALSCASPGGDGRPPAEGEKRPPSLPSLSEIRWGELLTPEPGNAAAVALTAALAWAGATLLVQLALISAAIFAAAVKYSFVAALLLFVLIALL